MSHINRILGLEVDQQGQEFLRSEPCLFYPALPPPNNVHTLVPSPGNAVHNIYYGVPHQHPPALPNHYNPYMAAPSASRDFPVPVNHGPQFNKRKNAEGIPPGNVHHHHHALAGPSSSSSVGPVIATAAHESDGSMDAAASFNHNHLIQGSYIGQAHPRPGNPWMELQFNGNGSETQNWAWNRAAPLPFVPGGVGGCVDTGNMGMHGYQSNGGLTSFVHPPIPQGHPSFHPMPPNIHGMRGHGITFAPQMTPPSRRHLEAGPRYMPSMPAGFGLYQPHRRDIVLERNTRLHNLNMRVLPEDGVALLDVPGYHEVNDNTDQHRDMRLDIDHMSYEELLALGEQIGTVRTGLSDEVIISHLKTREFSSPVIPFTLESAACSDHETDFCVICQTDYNNGETLGTLNCGHEYHADCVKKWLVVKNTCPICKSTGLSTVE